MAPSKDLYELLGVARDSSQDVIRKAYLKLAHKYHPDKTGGDKAAETKLKEINGAYDILKNPEKRAQYDRFGSTDGQPFQGGFGGFSGAGFGGQGFEAPFEDFFDMLFGHGGRRRGGGGASRPGNDLEFPISITLEEVAAGAKKKIRFARRENCTDCKGTGAAPGSKPERCPQCGGAGKVRASHGFFSVERTCGHCQGAGQINAKPCHGCGGTGSTKDRREISVDIPAGVDAGSRLRVTGEGEAGVGGGPHGDLYLVIDVVQHPIFVRRGVDLFCEMPVSFVDAALGGSVSVPTLTGEDTIKINAGAQTGEQVRLRGKGLPDIRGYRQGDLVVALVVETPTKLSRKQRDLLTQFKDASDAASYPHQNAFWDKVNKHRK